MRAQALGTETPWNSRLSSWRQLITQGSEEQLFGAGSKPSGRLACGSAFSRGWAVRMLPFQVVTPAPAQRPHLSPASIPCSLSWPRARDSGGAVPCWEETRNTVSPILTDSSGPGGTQGLRLHFLRGIVCGRQRVLEFGVTKHEDRLQPAHYFIQMYASVFFQGKNCNLFACFLST